MSVRVRSATVLALAGIVALTSLNVPSLAQTVPLEPTTTTTSSTPKGTTTTMTPTTAAGATTTTTAPKQTTSSTTAPLLGGGGSTTTTAPVASEPDPNDPTTPGSFEADDDDATEAPEGAQDEQDVDGETTGPPAASTTPRTIPPEAQQIINSVNRSPASFSKSLAEGVARLVELGLSPEEAAKIGFGRFPVGGSANYVHDWLFPRYGPGFRFHLGTDVFAAAGTPLRSPVDGFVESGVGNLGGLYVKIYMEDGTYFYYAHMSGLVDGFVSGMAVTTGDVVGYVGDSGNALGGKPHLHIGIYPQGGPAIDPKPVLDQFLADALERLPAIEEQVRARQAIAPAAPIALPSAPATPRAMLSTALLRPMTDRLTSTSVSTETLLVGAGHHPRASMALLESSLAEAATEINWDEQAALAAARTDLLERSEALALVALGPFLDSDTTAQVVNAVVWSDG